MGELQKNSLCKLSTSFGEDELLVSSMRGQETISQLFRFELELSSGTSDLAFEEILGQKVSITIDLAGDRDRFISGIVSRFGQMDSPGTGQTEDEGGDTGYWMEVVPWTWLLTRRQNSRIFQEKTIPQIVEEIFEELGFTDYKFQLTATYHPLVNCVQYQETDFAFISRLLESEGIFYFFQHTADRHEMMLIDSADKVEKMPGMDTALFHSSTVTEGSEDRVEAWHVEKVFQPGNYAMTDYNFMDPSTDLQVTTASNVSVTDADKFEIFTYPGDYTNLGAEAEGKIDKGDGRVRLRMEEGDARAHVARGRSTCRAFQPGFKFDFEGHSRADNNATWLMTNVEHNVGQDGTIDEDGENLIRYRNTFSCIPNTVPYRPPMGTPRPRVNGPQTAVVVGPENEEIYVDKFGRVKVQFHWDRYGKLDENSSCWVRVAQGWAGKNWGMIFHPRLGQEVVVEFLEGNPDRPLITGRVYNGMQPIPYSVPTQSGILTRSTKEGSTENFNEIRFEDNKDNEEFYIHAEKDMKRVVENNDDQEVGADQKIVIGDDKSVEVKKSQTEKIGTSMSLSVGGSRTVKVAKDCTETVDGKQDTSVAKDFTETVGGGRTVTVGKDNSTTIEKSDSTTVGAGSTLEVGKDRALSVGKGLAVKVGKGTVFETADGFTVSGKKVSIEAKDELIIKVGSAKFSMKKNGDVKIDGKKISVKGSGDLILKGSKIAQN